MRVSEVQFFGKPGCRKEELIEQIKLKSRLFHPSDYSASSLHNTTNTFLITDPTIDSTLIIADHDDLPISQPNVFQVLAFCIDISEEINLSLDRDVSCQLDELVETVERSLVL